MPLRDIRGQDSAIRLLIGGVDENRTAHAYLFLGPQGVGKLKTALEFAKFLNCQNPKGDSCGTCPSCIKIEKLMHPDLFLISKDEEKRALSIDKIRELKNRLSLKPFEARYKVAIIVNAEDMNEEASNSLLKILEEPTPDTVFILITSNQKALADTVVSRCQLVRFRSLTRDEIIDILIKGFCIEEDQAKFLSAVSGANLKKALSFKEEDKLLWRNKIIDEFNLYKERLGKDDTILSEERELQTEALDILLGFYRDIMVYKFTDDRDLIINADRLDSIAKMAQELEASTIQYRIKEIGRTKALLEESNINSKSAIRSLQEKLT